jgi:hypothetical protein
LELQALRGSLVGNMRHGGLSAWLVIEKMNASGLFRSSGSLDPTLHDFGL